MPEDFDHGRHLCPICCKWVPGAIDTDHWLICRGLGRDTSWAWCDECKQAHREERERMLAAEPKLGAAALTVNRIPRKRSQELISIVCDVCGIRFEGQRGKKRCSPECRRLAANALARRIDERSRRARAAARMSNVPAPHPRD